jgi:omega-amidase
VTIKVAACQYATALGNKERNLALSLDWLDRAGRAGAQLVALPELANTGYAAGERFLDLAETVPGPTTEAWGKKARQYGCHIVGGLCRVHPAGGSVLYNTAVLIDPAGEVAGVYSKVVLPLYLHSWSDETATPVVVEEAEIFRRGDALPVFRTSLGTIGIQICQDAVYPEFIRVMTLQGAQLIVQILNGPAVPTMHEPDITPLTTRVHAFDNGVWILAANKVGRETFRFLDQDITLTFHGESHLADPYGNFAAKAPPEQEALMLAEVDLAKAAKAQWQAKFLRDWRPELLGPLANQGVTLG